MFWVLLITMILGGVIGIVYFISGLCGGSEKEINISGICLSICVGSMILFIIISCYFSNMPYKYSNEPCSIEYIVALKDNSEINGKFSGGRYYIRGYINEKSYYSYMVKLNNGGMVANKVPSDSTIIYEVDENFRVEWWVKSKNWLGCKDEVYYWKIYIPKGSIITDYSIDLE